MIKTTYTIDGKTGYNLIPEYLEKDGFMKPVIPANFTIETVTETIEDSVIETNRQNAKPLKLKTAENIYITIANSIPNYVHGMDAMAITAILQTNVQANLMTQADAMQKGLELLGAVHDIELAGGTWKDIPANLHVI